MSENYFMEIDHFQACKEQQHVSGDVFLSKKIESEQRAVSVLSDGLGSGVKANVLAALTATMAANFVISSKDIAKTARSIMNTLPVCNVRKISYSTFTIVDTSAAAETKIIEYDNPPYILLRCGEIKENKKESVKIKGRTAGNNVLQTSSFKAELGDRLIFFSDGVTQAGIGQKATPLGWGYEQVKAFILRAVSEKPQISARDLARLIVAQARMKDCFQNKDDITCGIIYFRQPRQALVLSGPPIDRKKDILLAQKLKEFSGKKIICGGTTANILARELEQKITMQLNDLDSDLPPSALMPGVDLITEGILTLGKVSEYLEEGIPPENAGNNAAAKMLQYLLASDKITFLVGTKINETHQDPNMPLELEIRRNIVKKIKELLEKKYLKETALEFI